MSKTEMISRLMRTKLERCRTYLAQAWIVLPKNRREAYRREFDTISDQIVLLQDRIANEDFNEVKA